jgi:outer membrane protein
MFCMHCGVESPKAARFCPSCGTAIARLERSGAATKGPAPVTAAVGRVRNESPPLRPSNNSFVRKTIIAGVILVCAVGALAIYMKMAHVFDSPLSAVASTDGTDDVWDGLDPKEVVAAKNAIDADIEQEERAASSAARAMPERARSSPTAMPSDQPSARSSQTAMPSEQPSARSTRIGVVTFKDIMQTAPETKIAMNGLQQEFLGRQKNLFTVQADLKVKNEKLQNEGSAMAEADRTKAEQELRVQQSDFLRKAEEFRVDVERRKNEELTKVQQHLVAQIQQYAIKKHYDMVVTADQSAFLARSPPNITTDVQAFIVDPNTLPLKVSEIERDPRLGHVGVLETDRLLREIPQSVSEHGDKATKDYLDTLRETYAKAHGFSTILTSGVIFAKPELNVTADLERYMRVLPNRT